MAFTNTEVAMQVLETSLQMILIVSGMSLTTTSACLTLKPRFKNLGINRERKNNFTV